jgi:hypothetical protein
VTSPSIEPVVVDWAAALVAINARDRAKTNIKTFFIFSFLS